MKAPQAPKQGKPTKITGKAGFVTIYATGTAFTLAYVSGGERKREKRNEWPTALERAREILEDLNTGAAHVRSFTAKEAALVESCVELLRPIETTLSQAVREYVEAANALGGRCSLIAAVRMAVEKMGESELPEVTVGQLVTEFLNAKRREKVSDRYHNSLRLVLDRFAKAHKCNIDKLKTVDLQKWLDAQKGSCRTKKNIAASVQTLFHYAKKIGYLPRTINTEADYLSIGKVVEAAPGIYSPETLRSVLDANTGKERLAVAIAAFTGIRTAEIHRLEWADFGSKHITISAHKAKTASRRLVPILPALEAVLAEYERKDGRVFDHNKMETHASRMFSRAFRKAGLKTKPNGFRHSYASYRLAITQSKEQVSFEMGNSPRKLDTNYRELVTPKEAAEWFSVTLPNAKNITPMEAAA
jgi:integrase